MKFVKITLNDDSAGWVNVAFVIKARCAAGPVLVITLAGVDIPITDPDEIANVANAMGITLPPQN